MPCRCNSMPMAIRHSRLATAIRGISWRRSKLDRSPRKGRGESRALCFLAAAEPCPESAQLDFGAVKGPGERRGLLGEEGEADGEDGDAGAGDGHEEESHQD